VFEGFPSFDWSGKWGGLLVDKVVAIDTDILGNLHVLSAVTGNIDVDSTFNENYTGFSDDSSSGMAYMKFGPDGTLLDAKFIEGVNSSDIELDSKSNIYIAGNFNGIADFDPGPNEKEVQSVHYLEAFLLKLDSSGYFQWVKNWAGGIAARCEIDNDDNIYTCGDFGMNEVRGGLVKYSTFNDLGSGDMVIDHPTNGNPEIYLMKFSPDGEQLWVDSFGCQWKNFCYGLDISRTGYIAVSFDYQNEMKFDPGPYDGSLPVTGEVRSAIAIFNSDGALTSTIALDYILGLTGESSVFDLDGNLIYYFNKMNEINIRCIDTSGNEIWTNRFSGNGVGSGNYIDIDRDGNIFLTGNVRNSWAFGDSTVEARDILFGDPFVCGLSPDGESQWVRSWRDGHSWITPVINTEHSGKIFIGGAAAYERNYLDPDAFIGIFNLTDP
jgi:hypothetical protein